MEMATSKCRSRDKVIRSLISSLCQIQRAWPRYGQKSSGEGNRSRSDWHRNGAPYQERHCLQRGIYKLEMVLVLYARITSSTHNLNYSIKH